MEKALNAPPKRGKIPVVDGYALCPRCRSLERNSKLQRIDRETTAQNIPMYCRKCKIEIIVDIEAGQCFESQSR